VVGRQQKQWVERWLLLVLLASQLLLLLLLLVLLVLLLQPLLLERLLLAVLLLAVLLLLAVMLLVLLLRALLLLVLPLHCCYQLLLGLQLQQRLAGLANVRQCCQLRCLSLLPLLLWLQEWQLQPGCC
jgi:hypothetical protein